MKRLLTFLFLFALCSASASAQQTATPDTVPGRFFIGFAISNTSYGLQYRQGQHSSGSHRPIRFIGISCSTLALTTVSSKASTPNNTLKTTNMSILA